MVGPMPENGTVQVSSSFQNGRVHRCADLGRGPWRHSTGVFLWGGRPGRTPRVGLWDGHRSGHSLVAG